MVPVLALVSALVPVLEPVLELVPVLAPVLAPVPVPGRELVLAPVPGQVQRRQPSSQLAAIPTYLTIFSFSLKILLIFSYFKVYT